MLLQNWSKEALSVDKCLLGEPEVTYLQSTKQSWQDVECIYHSMNYTIIM